MSKNVLAFSGGKDSTACAIRLAELGEDFDLLFTPTGNELADLNAHIEWVAKKIDRRLVKPPNRSLAFWIEEFGALPNFRQRWCTRLIKIAPCIEYLKLHPGTTLMVGLRVDEPEREGLYGDYATYRYPLREWRWGITEVLAYLDQRGVVVPPRTDCAVCYGQRIGEWYNLWKDKPDEWAKGERWEKETGHTFRSAQRDTWPAAMKDMRQEFEAGRQPRGLRVLNNEQKACRVCSM